MNKSVRFRGIAGLKLLATIFIFLWHAPVEKPPIDLGARLCEFFFVASGFLFCISHFQNTETVNRQFVLKYMRKKVIQMWPAHFIGFVAALLLIPIEEWFLPQTLVNAFLNLSLTQSWVNNQFVFWGFNGVSWYLSSLLFCYLIGFEALKLIQKINRNWVLFVVLFSIRYVFEAIPIWFPGKFWNTNFHISPIPRALEFALGMVIAAVYLKLNESTSKKLPMIVNSVVEIFSFIAVILVMLVAEGKWLRGAYAPLFCGLLFCFAFDNGVISKVFSIKPIQWLSKFQLEIYLFHVLVFQWIEYRYPLHIQMLIYLSVLICVITIYRLLLKRPLERFIDVCTKWSLGSRRVERDSD